MDVKSVPSRRISLTIEENSDVGKRIKRDKLSDYFSMNGKNNLYPSCMDLYQSR